MRGRLPGPVGRVVAQRWCSVAAVRSLDGLPDDVLLLSLTGHTHGHSGVALRTDAGWLLHAGDAYFDQREVDGPRRRCATRIRGFEAVVTTNRRQRTATQTGCAS